MQLKLEKCICKQCGQYWPSEAAKKRHFKGCHGKNRNEPVEDKTVFVEAQDEMMCNCQNEEEETQIKVIEDFGKHLLSPFVEDTIV